MKAQTVMSKLRQESFSGLDLQNFRVLFRVFCQSIFIYELFLWNAYLIPFNSLRIIIIGSF